MKSNTEEDFWRRVQRGPGCWVWQGRKARGYGQFDMDGKAYYAHRLAYTFTHGTIPKGMDILHSCDNPSCVNPAHLRAGTHDENMQDMVSKGRSQRSAGEDNPVAKLTWEQVREIRARYRPGVVTLQALARDYGVHVSLVSLVIRNKIWKEAA